MKIVVSIFSQSKHKEIYVRIVTMWYFFLLSRNTWSDRWVNMFLTIRRLKLKNFCTRSSWFIPTIFSKINNRRIKWVTLFKHKSCAQKRRCSNSNIKLLHNYCSKICLQYVSCSPMNMHCLFFLIHLVLSRNVICNVLQAILLSCF